MKLRFWCREKSRYENQCDYMLKTSTNEATHSKIPDRERGTNGRVSGQK